jgi:hypothetical protein
MMPQPIVAGYSTGISHPLNSTILAPICRCTAFSAVLRMEGVVSTEDKAASGGHGLASTNVYRNTRFFGGSNRENLETQDFLAIGLFLRINHRELTADPVEAIAVILKLAEGGLNEPELAEWIRNNWSG